jgi:putative N6-adenine-specific DNA methylase
MDKNLTFLAKTFYGFEPLLEKELRSLGAREIKPGNRLVTFKGDLGFLYKANLALRTALKILMPIHRFAAADEEMLYQAIYRFPWEDYLSHEQSFAIDSVVLGDRFTHSLYVTQKTKDAIVDRFRKQFGKRPSVDTQRPDLQIHLHIQDRQATLSLDSSGASLHKRGYRFATNIAPINEVLAAGLILHSGWDGSTDFFDPMCGSGTILIEAAMLAANIPANINREEFAFERWSNWDPDLFETIRESLLKKIVSPSIQITGSDKAPSAVRKALENVAHANLEAFVTIARKDFFHTQKESEGPLHLLTNPPYGERLEGDIDQLYENIGNTFKKEYPNTQAWMITSNMEAMKSIGLRPSRKIKLFNGKLESRLLHFPIYAGTKKIHKHTNES